MFKRLKLLILAIFLILPISAFALTTDNGELVILEKDEVVNGNYYAAGTSIEINGTVNGDIFAAGNTIVVDSENINGDIFAVGSNITIKGKVNGSLRLAGESIYVMADVSGNAMTAGQNFRFDKDAKLAGHLTFWGQMLNVAGEVGRIEGAFESLRLSGIVNNDVDVYLASDKDKENLNISDEASIGGTLYYKALKELDINSNAAISNVSFNEIIKENKKSGFDKGDAFGWIIEFFGMLVVGMIGLYIWPKFFSKSYGLAYEKPVKTFFRGLLLLIVTPLASILVAVTMIGLPIAIIVMMLWAIGLYLAKVMAAWLIGKFIKGKLFKNTKWSKLLILTLGIVVYILIAKIPYNIGMLISMLIYILAWGVFANIIKFKKD